MLERARYPGAILVGNVLRAVAWLVLTGGFIGGIVASLAYECEDTFGGPCSDSDLLGRRLLVLLAIWAGTLLYAVLAFALGYMLLLLSDIEANTTDALGPDEDNDK